MRRESTPEDLIARWTLVEDEWRLVGNSELTGANREHQPGAPTGSTSREHQPGAPGGLDARPAPAPVRPRAGETLLLERVLAEPRCRDALTDVDRRALTRLFWSNVNPYGRFRLDMERHLDLVLAPAGLPGGPPLVADPVAE